MRISDWSSDVCSSDLHCCRITVGLHEDGVGIHRAQFRQAVHMLLNLQHPVLAAVAPAQMLKPHFMDFVTKSDVGPKKPAIEVRNAADHHRIAALERRRHERSARSEEHTSELQSLMRISYAVFCLKKQTKQKRRH